MWQTEDSKYYNLKCSNVPFYRKSNCMDVKYSHYKAVLKNCPS